MAGLSGRILAARIFAARERVPPITSRRQIRRRHAERGEGGRDDRRWRRALAAGQRERRSGCDDGHRRRRESVHVKAPDEALGKPINRRMATMVPPVNRAARRAACEWPAREATLAETASMSDHLTPIPWLDVLLILALGRLQRRPGDERAGDRVVARGAPEGDGQERQRAARNARSTSPPTPAASCRPCRAGSR